MLEHADARDLVEAACAKARRQVPIVHQQDLGPICQPSALHPLASQPHLLFGQRDPDRPDAIVLNRMHDQRAPAATDVEQALTGGQTQLAADMVQLRPLGLVDRFRAGPEVGAGIDHALVKPKAVELVADVIVVRNR